MQQQFAIFVLIAWVPLTVGLFTAMSSRKVAVVSLVGAWLILPPVSIPLPGIPDFSKLTATTFGLLLGAALFDLSRYLNFRPRWYDLPMVVWCLGPMFSAISNGDTAYDGMSFCLRQLFLWGLPYFIGRLYLNDLQSLRDLAIGIIVGGICYIVPCVIEMRMSPQFSMWFYGVSGNLTSLGMRLGGYRPKVFLAHGLELGTYMCAASLAGWWIWRSGYLKQMFGLPFGTLVYPALLGTTILCRSSGALLLFLLGVGTLWVSTRFRTRLIVICIILIPPLYYSARITRIWSGANLVDFIQSNFDEERAKSLNYRFRNENLIIARALDRPILGWGGFGRFLQIDPDQTGKKKALSVPDGLWVIALGTQGLLGLMAVTLVILLPPIVFITRFPPGQWLDPQVAPAAMFAVLLSLFMIDCLLNAMINLIYVAAMGGLISTYPSRSLFTPQAARMPEQSLAFDPRDESGNRSQESLARRYSDLGRLMASQGRREEAKPMWLQSLGMWDRLTSTYPRSIRYRISRSECSNDVAWFLINSPDADPMDAHLAVNLALKAVENFPDRSDFWNTLGAAYYRAGNAESSNEAMLRSLTLQQDQGTAYDYFYLSLACSRLEQYDIARSWYEQGRAWLKEHHRSDADLLLLGREAEDNLNEYHGSESNT